MSKLSVLAAAASLCLGLGGCALADPLAPVPDDSEAIVVGSQDYYSNEIVAEIWAQSLEAAGFTVRREFRIGQREVYLPEVEAGAIELFPEYSGPLLRAWSADAPARTPAEVEAALRAVLPAGLKLLDPAEAADQDSFVVTTELARAHGLEDIGDLSKLPGPVTVGANSEAVARPHGPAGLARTYGVEATLTPIEDSGGPLTVKALRDGDIQVAVLYTANPALADPAFTTLGDPEGLFLAANVVPLARHDLPAKAVAVVDAVNARLTTQELLELNRRSVETQASAAQIAEQWLSQQGLLPALSE